MYTHARAREGGEGDAYDQIYFRDRLRVDSSERSARIQIPTPSAPIADGADVDASERTHDRRTTTDDELAT